MERFTGPPGGPPFGKWVQLDDNPASASIVANGREGKLYQLHKDGSIWLFVGPAGAPFGGKRMQLDGNADSVKIAAGATVCQMDRNGSIRRFDG